MEMRLHALRSFILYRRNSFKFPQAPEIQLAVLLKLYKYEFQRHFYQPNTAEYVKNHYAAILKFESLLNEHLTVNGKDFLNSEGWLIGPPKQNSFVQRSFNSDSLEFFPSYTYLYTDQLNNIHFN